MSGADTQPEAWVTLLVIAGLAACWLAGTALARRGRREQLEALLLTLCTGAAAWLTWAWLDVPTGWITVLHEGTQLDNLAQPYGDGHHAGSLWTALVHMADPGPLRLRSLVRLNAALMVGALGVAAGLGRLVVGWRWTVLVLGTLVLPASILRHAVMSEVPAGLVALLITTGALLVALHRALARAPGSGAGRGTVAWLLVASGLLSQVRPETVPMLGLPALAMWAREDERIARRLRGAWAWLWPADPWSPARQATVVGVLAASLLADPVIEWGIAGSRLSWVASGLALANPSMLVAPVVLAGLVSAALVLLALLGALRGLREGWELGGLVVGAVIAWRACYRASHLAPFEIVRYSLVLLPALWVLALFGGREGLYWLRRLQLPQPRWMLGVALLLTWAMPPVHGTFRAWVRSDGLGDLGWLSTARQVEARFLLTALERYPDCRFHSRITPRPGEGDGWRWVAWDARSDRIVLDEAPGEGCTLFFRGSDCSRADAPGEACTPWEQGEPLERVEVHTLPYNDPEEWGRVDRAVLALYRLSGE